MRKKLTTKTIESLCPADKRYEVRDEFLQGLHVRVSPSAQKVWYLSARVNRRARRIKIGRYPIVSLADARAAAQKILRDIALGTYQEQALEPSVPLLEHIISDFIEFHAKPNTKDWRGTERILEKFGELHARPITEIKRTEIVRILDGIVRSGAPFRANRALAAIKKLFAWCVERGAIDINPIAGLRPPTKEVSRDRVLSDPELKAIWQAAAREEYPYANLVQLLILTAQRRGEVAGMRWSELDFEKGIWTIPAGRAKNNTASFVPLSPLAIDIVRGAPRFLNSDLVFTTNGRNPISGFGKVKRRLDASSGASDWRLHDLRRTVATGMAIMGAQPHVIEAVLNHRSGIVSGVAAIYNRHAYLEEKRAALRAWSSFIEDLAKGSSIKQRQTSSTRCTTTQSSSAFLTPLTH